MENISGIYRALIRTDFHRRMFRFAGIWLVCIFIQVQELNAQAVVPEFGFGIGMLNYAGDLSRGYNFRQIGIGAQWILQDEFQSFHRSEVRVDGRFSEWQ